MMRHSVLTFLTITSSLLLLDSCRCSCSDDSSDIPAPEETASEVTLDTDRDTLEEPVYVKLKINPIGGSLAKVFNDKNDVQVAQAQKLGITPITDLHSAWHNKKRLNKIETNSDFYVDSLTHSVPFLVPEADSLLHEIGKRFNDSLAARGGGDYIIKVTSVLRTAHAVSQLRKRNINATEASAHQFGTTFDISYIDFKNGSHIVPRSQEDLKNLLGEILKQLRDEKKCYVKYERKQGCFHITVRD